MSTLPATTSRTSLGPSTLTAKAVERAVAGLSLSGVMLFLTGVLVVGSGFKNLRPEVMGLWLHPYLFPVGLALPFLLMTRLHLFPLRILASLVAFYAIYVISVCNGKDIAIGEIFKLGTAIVTIIVCALLVRRRGDFVAGAMGLGIAVAALAYKGLTEETTSGIEIIEGANKNTYSLFALPAILLAGYIALAMKSVPVAMRTIPVLCAMPSLAAIFMSGNRSGWLGALLVGGMLFWNRRAKGVLLVGLVALVVGYGITHYGNMKVFDERMKQTLEGNESDEYRKAILWACLDIGAQNPLIGVSPQRLPYEIGRRTSLKFHYGYVESHNLLAHLFAGSGLLCVAALLAVGWTIWTWKPRDGNLGPKGDPARDALQFLRMMAFLWFVRGMFTRDIMYNPSFNIGLGLAIGLCMLAEAGRKAAADAPRPRPAA